MGMGNDMGLSDGRGALPEAFVWTRQLISYLLNGLS